jgi:hypothetical protein
MVSRRDEQQRRGIRADPVEGEQAGGAGGDQGDDELAGALELAVQEYRAPSQLAQRDPGRVTGDVAGPRPQRRDRGHQGRRGVLGEPGPQVVGASHDQGPGLAVRPGAFSRGAAPVGHQRADRLHGAIAALGRAAGPAGLGGPGSADGIQRAGACPAGGGPGGPSGLLPRPGRLQQ